MLKLILLALALLPFSLTATPTRALTLDNQQMLIADDYDATVYYHLAPNFKNHFYVDILNNGQERGWAFVDAKIVTLAIWWNKAYAAKSLFEGLDHSGFMGYQYLDLNTSTVNAHAPLEHWVQSPEVKLSAGLAYELSERINLGFCVQWADLEQTRNSSDLIVGPPSLGRFTNGVFYPSLAVRSYKNTQKSSGFAWAPSIGISAERYHLDLKFESISNGLNNSHTEQMDDGNGTRNGTLTQSLKDKGKASWLVMGKLRIPFSAGNLIVRGGYFDSDFSTQHTQLGSFSGISYSAKQLAGLDHVDAEETFTDRRWDAMVGWTMDSDSKRGMAVFGLGVNSVKIYQNDVIYLPKMAGATFNDIGAWQRAEEQGERMSVPLLMGAELEIAKFAKWSGMASYNLYSRSSGSRRYAVLDPDSGQTLFDSATDESSSLSGPVTVRTGVGLYFGSFTWDFAVNELALASSWTLAAPVYQSTLTWGY